MGMGPACGGEFFSSGTLRCSLTLKASDIINIPMAEKPKTENFACSLDCGLIDAQGQSASKGKSKAAIEAENLTLKTEAGAAHVIALRDIERITQGNFIIEILLGSGEKWNLSGLGYGYEDFLRILHQNRNELILADMLADEALVMPDVAGEAEIRGASAPALLQGKCRIRLYRTSLAVLPLQGEIMRFPLGCLKEDIRAENFRLLLETDDGEKIVFFKLGRQLDLLKKSLADTLTGLAVDTRNYLAELLPKAKPEMLAAAASLLRDGKAALRSRIETQAPGLWRELEAALLASEIGESYRHLQSLGKAEKAAFGFKRGLMGSLSGDAIWFLVPIYSADPAAPGNALAMEAGTIRKTADVQVGKGETPGEEPLIGGSGKATYFFRLVSRGEYGGSVLAEKPDRHYDEWIRRFNRAMLAVNFRREPIYLDAEKLLLPEYRHYRFSLQRLPELRMLRDRFIGRVMHRDPKQWRQDVAELLQFNVRSKDDALRWKKGE
jgi:hypothetical protein